MAKLPDSNNGYLKKSTNSVASSIMSNSIPEESSPTLDQDVFSYDLLLKRLMGDSNVVNMILRTYLEDSPPQVDELKKSLRTGDYNNAAKLAHKLKGAAANIQARNLRDTLLEIELSCKNTSPSKGEEFAQKLERDFSNLLKNISTCLPQ